MDMEIALLGFIGCISFMVGAIVAGFMLEDSPLAIFTFFFVLVMVFVFAGIMIGTAEAHSVGITTGVPLTELNYQTTRDLFNTDEEFISYIKTL